MFVENRLAQLRIKTSLLSKLSQPAVILFDEMEDVIENGRFFQKRTISKVYLNRLLEENATPIVWTTNSIEHIDPAVLRRMSYIIEVKPQRGLAQKNTIEKIALKSEFSLPEAEVTILARDYQLSPAQYATAMRAARLADGDVNDIHLTLAAASKALTGSASFQLNG